MHVKHCSGLKLEQDNVSLLINTYNDDFIFILLYFYNCIMYFSIFLLLYFIIFLLLYYFIIIAIILILCTVFIINNVIITILKLFHHFIYMMIITITPPPFSSAPSLTPSALFLPSEGIEPATFSYRARLSNLWAPLNLNKHTLHACRCKHVVLARTFLV